MVRLLTFNTLFKGGVRARLKALDSLIGSYDVACLQEVMFGWNARLLGSLDHRTSSGAGLVNGGLVTLSRARPVRTRFVRFDRRGHPRPEFLMRKGVQLVDLGDLVVLNTHLTANMDDDWTPANRFWPIQESELQQLAGLVTQIPEDRPVVVVGDFNVPRMTSLLAGFAAEAGLRNLMNDPEGTVRPTPEWPETPPLDHVFVRPGLIEGEARLVFKEPVSLAGGGTAHLSDHYGIEAELRLVRP